VKNLESMAVTNAKKATTIMRCLVFARVKIASLRNAICASFRGLKVAMFASMVTSSTVKLASVKIETVMMSFVMTVRFQVLQAAIDARQGTTLTERTRGVMISHVKSTSVIRVLPTPKFAKSASRITGLTQLTTYALMVLAKSTIVMIVISADPQSAINVTLASNSINRLANAKMQSASLIYAKTVVNQESGHVIDARSIIISTKLRINA